MPDLHLPDDLPHQLLIDGAWRRSCDGATFPVLDPATEQVLAHVSDATGDDGKAALSAAHAAQEGWAATPARERSELLRSAFDAVIARADDFAALMTQEMGKPIDEAHAEVGYGAEFLRWFSEEAPRISGRYQRSPNGRVRHLISHRPVGPCLFITPWNFPLAMATRKIAPALAAGCTVVHKPSEEAPLTALLFAKVLQDVGVPPGVVNVIPTTRAPQVTGPVIRDPRLRKLSFTGSTLVGKALLREAAENVLRCSMELGGNAPLIVFPDADLEVALEAAVTAKLRNMGEACTAANRFIVHESIADEFARRVSERFCAMNTASAGTGIGPVITARARTRIHGMVTDAVQHGARVLTGGQIPAGTGYFYPPTVVGDVPATSRLATEEIFGPVVGIQTFTTDDEAVQLANATDVGLAAFIMTRDLDRVLALGDRLEVGMIGVNVGILSDAAAPFGGVKHSGLGREGGTEGIHEFLDTVYLAVPTP